MNRLRNACQSRGHTMLELVAAMVASAMLLVGLGSVMLIARQIAYTPAASADQLEAAEAVHQLVDDLAYATFVTDRSGQALAFVVADRDGDGTQERIRYEWSGTPGDPLLRTLNGGTPAPVLAAVQDFNLQYTITAATTPVNTTTDGAAVLLRGNTSIQTGNDRDITSTNWSAQMVDPAAFTSLPPAGATHWNLTRIDFYGRKSSSDIETLLVQLRSTGGPNAGPTSRVLGQVSVPETSLTNSDGWNSVLFADPVRDLTLHRKYAITWAGLGIGAAARLVTDDVAASGVNETTNAGASWQFMPTRQTYYRVYGTYTTPGPTHDVTRSFLANVAVRLQANDQSHTLIETSVHPTNLPELSAAYWHADFLADPLASDANGDGAADWAEAQVSPLEVPDGVPFDPGSLIGGVWNVQGKLRTQPLNDFAEVTSVELRFRDTSAGGSGAVARINADWQGGLHAPIIVGTKLQIDGTQSLTLQGKPNDANEVVLFQLHGLPADFIRCRLTILPDYDLVNVQVNDVDQGTYTYPTYAPSSSDRCLAVYGDTTTAEFDYVDVRVADE